MSNLNNTNKKYKRPKQKTQSTTNPESSKRANNATDENKVPGATCPLAAKDSEWVDILQTPATEQESSSIVSDEEEVLQLVECEDGPEMKPLAIMFPGLLEKDPNTLEGVLNKVMSTTEVTRHLVDLGQKANFTFMKKADRLIPRNKQWLEKLTESSNSFTSIASAILNTSVSSDYDADNEVTSTLDDDEVARPKKRLEKRAEKDSNSRKITATSSEDIFTSMKQILFDIIHACDEIRKSHSHAAMHNYD